MVLGFGGFTKTAHFYAIRANKHRKGGVEEARMISLVPGESLGSQSESPDLQKGARGAGSRAQADWGK